MHDSGPCLVEEQTNIKSEDPEMLQMPGATDGATKAGAYTRPLLSST